MESNGIVGFLRIVWQEHFNWLVIKITLCNIKEEVAKESLDNWKTFDVLTYDHKQFIINRQFMELKDVNIMMGVNYVFLKAMNNEF